MTYRPHRMGGYHDGLESDAEAGPVKGVAAVPDRHRQRHALVLGDTGAYYVFVDPDSLKALNFSSATMILECH